MADQAVLTVNGLTIDVATANGAVRLIDDVSFDLLPSEVLCIVGESGSGKSVTALAIMRLLHPDLHVVAGSVTFKSQDVLAMTDRQLRAMRGRDVAMIFQDPMTSLNPVRRIGTQIAEMIRLHPPRMSRRATRDRGIELLTQVRTPNPEARWRSYPHEFSGGMRQRVMIAMAMTHRPAVIIADEPTTALDVTTQAQVLDVLADVRADAGSALLLITHDLGVVAEHADRIVVMYAGQVVERGTATQIFDDPRHPYTVGLLDSRLPIHADVSVARGIPGQPPTPSSRPTGCPYRDRCTLGRNRAQCATRPPLLVDDDGHTSACHFSSEIDPWRKNTANEVVEADTR